MPEIPTQLLYINNFNELITTPFKDNYNAICWKRILEGDFEELVNAITLEENMMEHPIKKGQMIIHAKGKESKTTYEVIKYFKQYAWVSFQIYTGRTHQIRVHAKHIGHPIVSDDLYGDGEKLKLSSIKKKNFKLAKVEEEERPLMGRQALHATSVQFEYKGKELLLEAPLPKDLTATLKQLEKWNAVS